MGKLSNKLTVAVNKVRLFTTWLGEWESIIKRRNEWRDCKLTAEEKKAANDFYIQNYGRKVPLYWHRLYKSYTGKFDPKYFPEVLFSVKLENKLTPREIAWPLGNKAFNPQCLYGDRFEDCGIVVPKAYLTDCDGHKWVGREYVSQRDFSTDMIKNLGEVIIKPTIDTTNARNVRLLDVEGGIDRITGDTLEEVLKEYKKNYIIQERVKNHESISTLNPYSVNTFRVITYLTSDGIKVAPLAMRIGTGGRCFDNRGIYIGVSEDGRLNATGYSKKGLNKYKEHPDTHTVFENYKLEGAKEVILAAKKLHAYLPQLQMISWDMAFNDKGQVTIIEVNTNSHSAWFPQMFSGTSFFGDYTAEMLSKIR